MHNTTNSLSQYSRASRSGSAFISPEQQRPIQYASVQATLQNPYPPRGTGFISPPGVAGAPTYSSYLPGQGPFLAPPVPYSSHREMITEQPRLAVANLARPSAIELTSTYTDPRYEPRFATNVPRPLISLPPELFLFVTQLNIHTETLGFQVNQTDHSRLKEIIEQNFIENNKRVLVEFFNDANKQPQDIIAQVATLSSSLQAQYESLKNPPRSASQVARSFSSPEPMRPDGADAKANNYLKLRLNAVIESLSQIESLQTYNEIKQCLSRLSEVNSEIVLDQKHKNLLALSYQESRSSSTLSSPASLQSLPQGRDGKAGILRLDPTRRIEELQTQNEHTSKMFNESQESLLAEQQKLSEATQQIEHLNQLRLHYEERIYQLTEKLSSYDRHSARLNLLAQQEIEIASTKQKIEELESQKQELQSQLNGESQNNQEQKDQLNQRLQEKQSEIKDQQKKINELGSLIAQSKEGIASINSDIGKIQESLSQNLAEFERDASKHLEATNRIISEGMVRDEDNSQSIQTLEQELSKIKMAYEELKNSSSELDKTQSDKEITIKRLQALLANSQIEKKLLTESIVKREEILTEREESLRKDLTGVVLANAGNGAEDWLPNMETSNDDKAEPDKKMTTEESIERVLAWLKPSISELTVEQLLEIKNQQNSTAQQSSTSEQGTQTANLSTQQLSRSIRAMASGPILSSLQVVETVNEARQNPINSTVFQQPASLQQASSSGPAEPHPDILLPASLQPASSPSASPRQTENSQSRLRTEIQAISYIMPA